MGGAGYAAFEHFHLFSKDRKVLAFGRDSGNFRTDSNFNYRLQQGHSLVHNPARMFNPGDFDSLENVVSNQSVHGRDFALALEANKYADGFPEVRGEVSSVTHRGDAADTASWPEGAQFEITVKDVQNTNRVKKVYSKEYIEAIGGGAARAPAAISKLDEGLFRSLSKPGSSGFGTAPALVDIKSHVFNSNLVARRQGTKTPDVLVFGHSPAILDSVRVAKKGIAPKTGEFADLPDIANVRWEHEKSVQGIGQRFIETSPFAEGVDRPLVNLRVNSDGKVVATFLNKSGTRDELVFDQVIYGAGQTLDGIGPKYSASIRHVNGPRGSNSPSPEAQHYADRIRSFRPAESAPPTHVILNDIEGFESIGLAASARDRKGQGTLARAPDLVGDTRAPGIIPTTQASLRARLAGTNRIGELEAVGINSDFNFTIKKWLQQKRDIPEAEIDGFLKEIDTLKSTEPYRGGVPLSELMNILVSNRYPNLSNNVTMRAAYDGLLEFSDAL